jgi:hypothetical protein
MMKVNRKYSFTNKRTIWRLLPSGDKLLIEERDEVKKQVYFSCIHIPSGKKILSDFQLDEKFWVGIEAFENDRIYFHRFIKPDMPGHIGITVMSLNDREVIWNSENLVFLFLYDEQVFAFRQNFETRDFFLLDAMNGNILKEYKQDVKEINQIREKSLDEQNKKYKNYLFPESYVSGRLSPGIERLIENKKKDEVISGSIDYVTLKNLLFLGFHTVEDNGKLKNNFNVLDINSGKIILEVLLNQGITSYIPDSFFVKDGLLFLIKDKNELIVYSFD